MQSLPMHMVGCCDPVLKRIKILSMDASVYLDQLIGTLKVNRKKSGAYWRSTLHV